MADYWKSQPKKFCDYCKCWIADNRPSIEFHERGKNHKENVAKRISEIKQKSLEKAKEEEKASKEFAAMEAAALKAYQEDLKRLGISSDETESSSPQVTSTIPRVSLSNQKEKKKRKKDLSNIDSVGASKWAEGVSSEGYKYYYNTITGESQWEKPEGFQGKFSKKATVPLWIEGLSEEGYTYYYNTETGESKWEKPEDFVPQVGDPLSSNSTETPAAPAESKSSDSDSESSEIQETEEEEKSETSTEAQKPKIKFRKKTKNDHAEETETKSKEEKSDGNQEQDSSSGSLEEKPKSPKKPDPYGEWKEIKQEDDPYEKIDLELPSTEDEYIGGPVADMSDPKVTFKEKTVTSLGDVAEGVAPVFKKRRFDNGKSRNLRQRGGDQ